MLSYELIEYIVKNDKIVEILENIGCTNIKPYSKEYRFSTKKYTNASANRIKKETLKYRNFSADREIYGDIFTLVMQETDVSFSKANRIIHKILKLPYTGFDKPEKKKIDILDLFKKAQNNYFKQDVDELKIYHEDIFREYIQIPYIGWIREGITPYTQKIFKVGYSKAFNRICVPWKYCLGSEHDFTGIIGRTLNEDYDILNIPKYLPLIQFPKSLNIFGLQENYKDIQQAGEVIIFEAEKSVMKCHSRLIRNTLALGGHALSKEQIRILVSLNVNIIFAMDNDMPEQLSIDMCNEIKNLRKVGYIYDKYSISGNKASPIDKGLKAFNALYNRVKWIN